MTESEPIVRSEPGRDGPNASAAGVAIYLLPALAYGLWFSLYPIDTPLMQPDSSGYVIFSSSRTAAYPYFLKLVVGLTGETSNVVHAQLWIYVAALGFLGHVIRSATGSGVLAAAAVLANMINPELNKYHFIVLTESLFISLTIVITALIIGLVRRPGWRRVALMSLLIGLAVAVRPIGYAFLPLFIVLGFFLWRETASSWRRFAVAAILPAAIVILMELGLYSLHNGLPRDSIVANHLFAKAGIVATGNSNPYPPGHPYRELWRLLEDDLRPVRALIEGAPNFGTRNLLLNHFEVLLQHQYARHEIAEAARRSGRTPNNVMMDVGRKRLLAAPGAYLGLVAEHYRGLWTVYGASHPGVVSVLNAYLDANRPLPLADAGGSLANPFPVYPPARFIQPAMLGLWAMTLAAICWLLVVHFASRASPALIIAGVAAMMVNGNYLLVVLTGLGIPRYTIAMWPGIMVAGVFFAWALAERLLPDRWLRKLKTP